MTLRDDAIDRAHRLERSRVLAWGAQQYAGPMVRAFSVVTDGERLVGLEGPLARGFTSLDVEWLASTVVAQHQDESLDFVLRIVGDGPPAEEDVEIYVVGSCPRCDAKVPLGPRATFENVGLVLLTGRPVGHDCPELWEP